MILFSTLSYATEKRNDVATHEMSNLLKLGRAEFTFTNEPQAPIGQFGMIEEDIPVFLTSRETSLPAALIEGGFVTDSSSTNDVAKRRSNQLKALTKLLPVEPMVIELGAHAGCDACPKDLGASNLSLSGSNSRASCEQLSAHLDKIIKELGEKRAQSEATGANAQSRSIARTTRGINQFGSKDAVSTKPDIFYGPNVQILNSNVAQDRLDAHSIFIEFGAKKILRKPYSTYVLNVNDSKENVSKKNSFEEVD